MDMRILSICHAFLLQTYAIIIVFFRQKEELSLVLEAACRENAIPRCTQGKFLKDMSEAQSLRDAWWFQKNGNVESGKIFSS